MVLVEGHLVLSHHHESNLSAKMTCVPALMSDGVISLLKQSISLEHPAATSSLSLVVANFVLLLRACLLI